MSNWKVSIKEVNDFDQEIKRETTSIKETLHKVQRNIDEIINMEQFQGEAADAAKEYFQVLHETLLQALIGVFEQLEANITKHLQAFSDEVDSSNHAIIQANYLESEEHDILDTYRQLEHVQRDVERIIDSVSDLTTAQSPSTFHPLESKENSIRVMSKLSRKLSSYSHSFSSDNQQLESSLHEIKVLMDKVAKQTNKHATTNDFQASLPFIASFVSDAIEQAPFERMLLTQEDRDRQSILASRHSRESRQLVGLRKYEKATIADSQLEERIQNLFRARLRQNLLQANRWWQETVTQQINVTNRYLLQSGIAYTDYLSNFKITGKDILNEAIVEPVTKSWDSAKIIGKSIADSAQERNEKKYESGYDFANYATFGIPDAMLGIKEGFDQRYQALQDDASVSTFLNYATMGTTEMTVNAVNPEEAYSPEHWLNSFGLATLIASGGLSAASNQILTKPTLTQPKPAVTIPKSQKTRKTQLIPFRTDYIKGKMDKALEQIGKVKVPVLVKEELATEFGSLSMLRMETKRLQEQLQLFKGRGNKDTGNGVNFGKYSTSIDDKVKVIEKVDLPDWIRDSFTDSNYRTVITEENITFYRTFGGGAKANGSFVTTSPSGNRINAKIDTALVPDWKNTREFEAVIEVPKGQILNIGRVEKQYTKTGALLEGDADQILLPQGWPSEWIKDIRKVPSK